MSFIAVASIMVDYILTAAISTVSAVENLNYFIHFSSTAILVVELGLIWSVATLNIVGIRENAKVTFGIFIAVAFVFLNLIVSGCFDFSFANWEVVRQSSMGFAHDLSVSGFFFGYGHMVAGISSCILAYSGVESVLQTASLVQGWKQIRKAYLFLALTVGLVTPLVSVLVLSSTNINFKEHETDLLTHYATLLNGHWFGLVVGILASITLLMAVNTAFVASSELIERVAHRYHFDWLIKTNAGASLYRIHIANAIFFSLIVLATQGQQQMLAEMYAVGLLASFAINLLSLLIYRYFMGTKEVGEYNVSRTGTLIFFIVIVSCFAYLSYHKPLGFLLWASVSVVTLLVGIYGTRKRSPEKVQIEKGETPMDIIFAIAESTEPNIHIYFKRPFDAQQEKTYTTSLFITFYSPRQKIPPRQGPNHFRIPFKRASVNNNIAAILELVVYECADRNITVYFGWPTSSWFDRLSTGVLVFQFIRFPKYFPELNFRMEKFKGSSSASPVVVES